MATKQISLRFIRRRVRDGRIYLTNHAAERMVERHLSLIDVQRALVNGEVIEQDPNSKPYPSCLVLGWLRSGDPLHIKCSRKPGTERLRIVTLYEPDEDQWEADFKARKRRR